MLIEGLLLYTSS